MIRWATGQSRREADCARIRPALLDLIDDPLGVAVPVGARDHLDVCGACRSDLAGIVLLGFQVNRTLNEARTTVPPADAWPRLRRRVTRTTPSAGRASSGVVGAMLAACFAIATLIPLSQPVTRPRATYEAGVDPAAIRAADNRAAQAEARLRLTATYSTREEVKSDRTNWLRLELISPNPAPADSNRVLPKMTRSALSL